MEDRMSGGSTTSTTTREYGVGRGTLAQGSQNSHGSQSTPTDQNRSPEARDLSRWFQVCQPFLLQTIQRRTEIDVNGLCLRSNDMAYHLLQNLEERYVEDNFELSFLNLTQSYNVQSHQLFPQDTISLRRSSTVSETSVGSKSSQVSDSFENDVQQSTTALMQTLKAVMDSISPPSKMRQLAHSILHFARSEMSEGQKAETQLYDAINDVKKILLDFQPEMHSIGFPDVGLKLNGHEEMFREDVARFFDIVRRERGMGMRALWKFLNDKKQPWKPWKDYEHSDMNSWQPWHEYGNLQLRTKKTGEEIKKALQGAVTSRDSFLKAACSMIDEVVLDFAREKGVEVHDKFQDGVLLQREFVGLENEEDPELNAWAQAVMGR